MKGEGYSPMAYLEQAPHGRQTRRDHDGAEQPKRARPAKADELRALLPMDQAA
jgi:hypothetical protein